MVAASVKKTQRGVLSTGSQAWKPVLNPSGLGLLRNGSDSRLGHKERASLVEENTHKS